MRPAAESRRPAPNITSLVQVAPLPTAVRRMRAVGSATAAAATAGTDTEGIATSAKSAATAAAARECSAAAVATAMEALEPDRTAAKVTTQTMDSVWGTSRVIQFPKKFRPCDLLIQLALSWHSRSPIWF